MALSATHDLNTLIPHVGNPDNTKTPTSPLLAIPRELRDEIYAPLLRSGDLAILRTSKQIYHEARERLYREGVFRIKIGFPDDDTRDLSFQQLWEFFHNFHFRLCFGPESTPYDDCRLFRQIKVLALLKNFSCLKRECLITIENKSSTPQAPVCHEVYEMKELFAEMARITTCIKVIGVFTPRVQNTCIVCNALSRATGMEHNEHLDLVENTLDNVRTLKGRLDPLLGPARRFFDEEGEIQRLSADMGILRKFMARKQ